MSNTELLTTAYASAHRSADLVSQLYDTALKTEVLAQDARPVISELRQQAQALNSAALELENRAKGMQPARSGD